MGQCRLQSFLGGTSGPWELKPRSPADPVGAGGGVYQRAPGAGPQPGQQVPVTAGPPGTRERGGGPWAGPRAEDSSGFQAGSVAAPWTARPEGDPPVSLPLLRGAGHPRSFPAGLGLPWLLAHVVACMRDRGGTRGLRGPEARVRGWKAPRGRKARMGSAAERPGGPKCSSPTFWKPVRANGAWQDSPGGRGGRTVTREPSRSCPPEQQPRAGACGSVAPWILTAHKTGRAAPFHWGGSQRVARPMALCGIWTTDSRHGGDGAWARPARLSCTCLWWHSHGRDCSKDMRPAAVAQPRKLPGLPGSGLQAGLSLPPAPSLLPERQAANRVEIRGSSQRGHK